MGGPCVSPLSYGMTATENGEEPLGINPVVNRPE